ncbi:HAUS augmin-like complex subunit 5 [Anguilla rostrata]|uniref:HAUS augmin-like complex subunit 5 n=1 Tax=Anguilla rostrata TaxID=7938 RepID=UPI0030CF5E1D
MSDRSLPQQLKRWTIEEFKLQPHQLPHDSYFKTLCLGQGASIWKYITQHIYNQRNVKVMRGNLQWFKMLQDKEVECVEGQSEAARRQELQREIEDLKAELDQLNGRINVAETQLAADERSLSGSWAEDEESRRRSVLLQAFRRRCADERLSLTQRGRGIGGHSQALGQLRRKAEVELVFGAVPDDGGDSLGPSGPEPQVLRAVRELCEERLLFFLSLLQSELKAVNSTGKHLPQEQREVVFQHWLSAVEDLIRSHPPGHILSALLHQASRTQRALQEKISSLDVEQEMAALRFRYENKQLQDISREEEELPSVKSLLQRGWEEEERAAVQLARTRARVRQQRDQLDALREQVQLETPGGDAQLEPLARAVFELELQCVVQAAQRDSVQEQCAQLGQLAQDRQEALRSLRSQWHSITAFRELVANKQEQIRWLIKANSNAKSELSRVHSEVRRFAEDGLGPRCGAVAGAASALRNTVSQEVRLTGSVSLAALSRRVTDGVQRVPAKQLSIHRLHCPTFHSLCESLAFPMYKAPEQLTAQTVSQQLELRFLRRLLQLRSLSRTTLQGQRALLPAPDQKALLENVREAEEELLRTLLPWVRELRRRAAQGLQYGAPVTSAIAHWWEQPAQFALPELQKGGLTLQKWLERWRLAAKALE